MTTREKREAGSDPGLFFLFDIEGFAPPSSSAKADDPVHRGFSAPSLALAITGCPAFAGHDD
jgi:hypothetical protein